MGNAIRQQTIWLPTGNPDTTNITSDDFNALGGQPGQLGTVFDYQERVYQRVLADSGISASNPVGIMATNQLAYWKNRSTFTVTNDRRQADYGSATQAYQNAVAGVIRGAHTAGRYIDILKKGTAINVLDGGNTFAAGESVIAENDSAASCDRVAVGTACTFQRLGFARGAASGGVVSIDLDVLEISK